MVSDDEMVLDASTHVELVEPPQSRRRIGEPELGPNVLGPTLATNESPIEIELRGEHPEIPVARSRATGADQEIGGKEELPVDNPAAETNKDVQLETKLKFILNILLIWILL